MFVDPFLSSVFQFANQYQIERSPQRDAMNRLSRSRSFPTHEHESRSCGSTRERKRFPLPFPPTRGRFYPLRFDFCLALRACEIQFARRKLTHARAPSQRIQSGFSQFSKFKEMIPPILSPPSETPLCPPPHLLTHVPSRTRTNLRLSPACAR